MIMPSAHQWVEGETLVQHFESRGISRREFMEFCGEMAVILGIGSAATPRTQSSDNSRPRCTTGSIQFLLPDGSAMSCS